MVILKHIKSVFNKYKILIFLGAFFNAPFVVCSQENLVLNPSFENLSCFPQTHYDFYCVDDWWNVNNNSIDIWNRYATIGNNFYNNPAGPQDSNWGNSYVSILLSMRWFSMSPPYTPPIFKTPDVLGETNYEMNEVLGGTFKKTLENKIYYYEFYVNVPDYTYIQNDPDESYLISNSLDLYTLYNDTLDLNNPALYSTYGNRVFKNKTIFKDTANWTKISGCFKATGGEKYFAVGSIRDTTEIEFEEFISWGNDIGVLSAIYLDNFSIYECDTCCLGAFPYEDHVNVSSNPGTLQQPTTFSVLLNPNTTGILSVFDSAGRLVAKEEFSALLSTYTLPVLANGIYHYVLATSNGINDVGKVLVAE